MSVDFDPAIDSDSDVLALNRNARAKGDRADRAGFHVRLGVYDRLQRAHPVRRLRRRSGRAVRAG